MIGAHERIWLLVTVLGGLLGAAYADFTGRDAIAGALNGTVIAGTVLGFELFLIQRGPGVRLRKLPLPVFFVLTTAVWIVLIGATLQTVAIVMFDQGYQADGEGTSFTRDLTFALLVSFAFNAALRLRSLIGPRVFSNVLLGRYYRPLREARVFMFLDLADSTTLAERLGDERVQALIGQFFFDIAQPVRRNGGETHRYIGDEVVVTWPLGDRLDNARCLRALVDIAVVAARRAPVYQRMFGVAPRYRVALHCGDVVAGEIGDDKREIVYFGDTVNTAARLAAHCKEVGEETLVSAAVLEVAGLPPGVSARPLGPVALRGKKAPIEVYGLDLPGVPER